MTNETVVIDAEFSEVETTDVDIVQALTVLPEQKTALDVFKNENNEAEIILSRARDHFSSLVFDMSTAKGRAECRAQAALIRKIKSKMEEIGKAEAAELKLLPKKIDATRNLFKTVLEELAVSVREPLTAYEAEEERKKAEEKAQKEAEKAKKEAEAEAKRQNVEHQRTINRKILARLEELGLDSAMATTLLKAMVKREIPNVTVNY